MSPPDGSLGGDFFADDKSRAEHYVREYNRERAMRMECAGHNHELKAKVTRLEDDVMRLKALVWRLHGHTALYGDDGELQCGQCPLDFRRATVTSIEWTLLANAAEAAARTTVDATPTEKEDR